MSILVRMVVRADMYVAHRGQRPVLNRAVDKETSSQREPHTGLTPSRGTQSDGIPSAFVVSRVLEPLNLRSVGVATLCGGGVHARKSKNSKEIFHMIHWGCSATH